LRYLAAHDDSPAGFIHCQCGVSRVPNNALVRWEIDSPAMLRLVFSDMNLNLQARIPDHLWQLGKATWAGKSREVWFGRCFRKNISAEVSDILETRPKAILFAPTEEGAHRWHSVVDNLTIALETTLAFGDGEIEFDVSYVEGRIEDAGMGVRTNTKKSPSIRSSRAVNIEALEKEMIKHLCDAIDYARATREHKGAPELLPRPTQKELGARVGLRPDAVSRCLNDPLARELQLFWNLADDLDGLLRWTGPVSKGRKL
jgi:hypothetical protein